MNKKIKIILFALAVVICLSTFVISTRNKVKDNKISATVVSVVHKPNIAEDGYYGIKAKDTSGREYNIDATGYLNTPLPPSENGKGCVDVPKVSEGDKITFNLPKSDYRKDTYIICHDEKLSGYYFRVE